MIPGGGLARDSSGWVACRPGFFLPVRVLSRYFRRVLLAALEDAFESGQLHFAGRLQSISDPRRFAEHLRPARQTECVVYANRPFAGPEQVLDYLGRYTHRIAIANQRLCALHDGSVRFRYTDYRRNGASRRKTMTLAATEFIRRMLLHVLPPGFHRIRYYGFLADVLVRGFWGVLYRAWIQHGLPLGSRNQTLMLGEKKAQIASCQVAVEACLTVGDLDASVEVEPMSYAATSGCRQVPVHRGEPAEYLLEGWACASPAQLAHNLVEIATANLTCFRLQATERRGDRLEKEQDFLDGFPIVALIQQLLGAF